MKNLAEFNIKPGVLGCDEVWINGQEISTNVHAVSLRFEEWQPAVLIIEMKAEAAEIQGQGVVYIEKTGPMDLDSLKADEFEDTIIRKMEALGCTFGAGAIAVLKEMRDGAQAELSAEVHREPDAG